MLRLRYPTSVSGITQHFGANPQNYNQFLCGGQPLPAHEGIDLAAPDGSPIFACADGIVSRVETSAASGNYGIHVRIKHQIGAQEYETIYAHFQRVTPGLVVGQPVRRGAVIGFANSTGNSSGSHLHLTLKKKGATARGEKQQLVSGEWVVYPCDIISPEPYLDAFGIP